MKILSIKVPTQIIEIIDHFVKEKAFISRSEIVRHAILLFVENLNNNLASIDINSIFNNDSDSCVLTIKIPKFLKNAIEQIRQQYGFSSFAETVRYILLSGIFKNYSGKKES
ncbi:MAG: ribbon-helix-helix domain-containing protein [Nitrososphaerota archaeon]